MMIDRNDLFSQISQMRNIIIKSKRKEKEITYNRDNFLEMDTLKKLMQIKQIQVNELMKCETQNVTTPTKNIKYKKCKHLRITAKNKENQNIDNIMQIKNSEKLTSVLLSKKKLGKSVPKTSGAIINDKNFVQYNSNINRINNKIDYDDYYIPQCVNKKYIKKKLSPNNNYIFNNKEEETYFQNIEENENLSNNQNLAFNSTYNNNQNDDNVMLNNNNNKKNIYRNNKFNRLNSNKSLNNSLNNFSNNNNIYKQNINCNFINSKQAEKNQYDNYSYNMNYNDIKRSMSYNNNNKSTKKNKNKSQ